MKITDVEVLVVEAPGDYGTSADVTESHGPKRTCVLVVSTDEGVTGYAQMETQPHVVQAIVGAPGEASGFFSGLRALAVGSDPLQVEDLWDRLFKGSFYFGRRGAVLQAISGIDIACWDIIGKATGLPVATLLGGKRRDGAVAYASTLFRTTEAGMRAAAEQYIEQGFRAVKFGWGPFGENLRQDVALVEAARDALGDDRDLMVDAGWRRRRTLKEAIQLVHALEPSKPFWIEEPCFPEDYDTYRRLSEAVSTRIAAGEAEATAWSFRHLAGAGIDVLQPDLSRCGGLTIARRIAYLADELNLMICPHAWGSDLLTAATLHFVAFLPHETFLEFNTSSDALSRSLVAEPLRLEDGMVRLPEGPGLGVVPDMEKIRALAVAT
ncbi:MAG: mandelate racemase/muconate lactonizing enzyme family protein [Conexibacter sp.]|nr:mandelate racemase/muconate lactonizing enzyme family protein [Conexibacter sp.]